MVHSLITIQLKAARSLVGRLSAARTVVKRRILHNHVFSPAFHRVYHHGLGLLLTPTDQVVSLLLHHGRLQLVHLGLNGYLYLPVTVIDLLRVLKFL